MSVFSFSPGSQFLGGQFLGAQSNEVPGGYIAFENFLKENLNNTIKKVTLHTRLLLISFATLGK